MANLPMMISQLVANENNSRIDVDVEATNSDDGVERSYEIHLPVYSYLIGLFVIAIGKRYPNFIGTDENKNTSFMCGT